MNKRMRASENKQADAIRELFGSLCTLILFITLRDLWRRIANSAQHQRKRYVHDRLHLRGPVSSRSDVLFIFFYREERKGKRAAVERRINTAF